MNKKIMLPFIILLGWLIPGAAHWMLNSRVKGYIIFSLTCLTLAIGLLLSDFRTLRFMDNHFYYLGQFGCGLVFLANLFLTGGHPLGVISLPYFEIGLLYTCVAGTLNLVLLLSLFQPRISAPLSGRHCGAPGLTAVLPVPAAPEEEVK
ncbi:MAG: hypothetical protein HY762_05255 [Planctomycetes bacterium]|nr:hypothetical protein [Planctomycetota bacterium]